MTDSANKGFDHDPLAWIEDASVEGAIKNGNDTAPVADPVESGSDNVLKLESMLTIQGVSALHTELCERLSAKDALDIDASAVESVDTACLQLLIVALRQARLEGLEFNLTEPSVRFLDCVRTLGVGALVGCGKERSEVAAS